VGWETSKGGSHGYTKLRTEIRKCEITRNGTVFSLGKGGGRYAAGVNPVKRGGGPTCLLTVCVGADGGVTRGPVFCMKGNKGEKGCKQETKEVRGGGKSVSGKVGPHEKGGGRRWRPWKQKQKGQTSSVVRGQRLQGPVCVPALGKGDTGRASPPEDGVDEGKAPKYQ